MGQLLLGEAQALPEAADPAKYAKALGLAIGLGPKPMGLNLRKGPLAYERGFAWVKEKVPLLAGLGAAIFVTSILSVSADLYSISRERKALEGALGVVTKDGEIIYPDRQLMLFAADVLARQDEPGRLNDERWQAAAETGDVARLLHELELQYRPLCEAKGLAYRMRVRPGTVQSDPILLQRIVGNLISNAIKYTPKGGVLVAARRHGGGLAIEIWDTGVGIAAERGDPLGQMKLSSRAKAQAVSRDATALLTACGLALRSFDD